MTNKTELLPCPFCGAQGIPQMSNRLIYAFVDHDDFCPMSGSMPTLEKWNTRAPAEDVRAVGEEPVYQSRFHWNDIWLDVDRATFEARSTDPYTYVTRALFSHPQRPVADLKRFDWDRDGGMVEDSTGEYVLWSDIEELNK